MSPGRPRHRMMPPSPASRPTVFLGGDPPRPPTTSPPSGGSVRGRRGRRQIGLSGVRRSAHRPMPGPPRSVRSSCGPGRSGRRPRRSDRLGFRGSDPWSQERATSTPAGRPPQAASNPPRGPLGPRRRSRGAPADRTHPGSRQGRAAGWEAAVRAARPGRLRRGRPHPARRRLYPGVVAATGPPAPIRTARRRPRGAVHGRPRSSTSMLPRWAGRWSTVRDARSSRRPAGDDDRRPLVFGGAVVFRRFPAAVTSPRAITVPAPPPRAGGPPWPPRPGSGRRAWPGCWRRERWPSWD
jgi:hypothetical protein